MSYTVTILNDAGLFDFKKTIHTWLKFDGPGTASVYFSFANSDTKSFIGFDSNGRSSIDDSLKKRKSTEKRTLTISKRQYNILVRQVTKFYNDRPQYDLTPEGDGDYSCVTAAAEILRRAGIYYLNDVQSPFGVANKIRDGFDVVEPLLLAKDVYDNILYFGPFVFIAKMTFPVSRHRRDIESSLLTMNHKTIIRNPSIQVHVNSALSGPDKNGNERATAERETNGVNLEGVVMLMNLIARKMTKSKNESPISVQSKATLLEQKINDAERMLQKAIEKYETEPVDVSTSIKNGSQIRRDSFNYILGYIPIDTFQK